MEFFERHAYSIASVGAAIVLLIVVVIVVHRLAPPASSLATWNGGERVISTGSYTPGTPQESSTQMPSTEPTTPAGSSRQFVSVSVNDPDASSSDASFDYERYLALLSTPSNATPSTSTASGDAIDAYTFIPTTMIATTPSSTRTPSQQSLYDYGNDIGTLIQNFETLHANMASILTNQAEDRENSDKAQALKGLGLAYKDLAAHIAQVEPPSTAASANTALAQAYTNVGDGLIAIPDAADGDTTFLAAIKSYDAKVDALNRALVAIATIFSISGVQFGASDPGSAFVFNGGGGL